MKILALETSTKYLGVAIAENEKILASFHDKGELKHSAHLIPSIDGILKKCQLRLKDISAIAISIGPGSFTGLRIGVATVKALNLALGIPVIAIPTLEVIAYNFINEKEKILCPLIDAKKKKVYSCLYKVNNDILHPKTGYMLTDIEDLLKKIKHPTLLFGDAIKLYFSEIKKNKNITITENDWFPKAQKVASLAFKKAVKKKFSNPDKLVPMYLHSKYCQVKGYK